MKCKLKVLATLLSMIFVFGLKAQDNRTELSRSILFENQSSPEELIIEIEEGVEYLNIDISCTISKGTIVVEIYDSKGKKQGNMTLGSKASAALSQKDRHEKASLEKFLKNPPSGKWLIKIIPVNVDGKLRINATQRF